MTDINELAQSLQRRATSAKGFGESLYVKGDDILALVEALASEKRICVTWRKTAEANSEKLEKAQQKNITQREYYEGVIADGSKRIAELESFISQSCYVFDGCDSDISDSYIDASTSSLMPKVESEPCHHCSDGSYSGLPGGACEHCMGTGLDNPAAELESRTVKLPKPNNSDQGWKIDPEFINKVQDAIGYDDTCECWEGTPSMELVEVVLLAAAGIKVEAE